MNDTAKTYDLTRPLPADVDARIQAAKSALAPPDPAGPSGSLACDGVVGLRAESAVEETVTFLAGRAMAAEAEAARIRTIIKNLRRELGLPIPRQPEPNNANESTTG